jgi:hypothetical protein
VPAERPAAPVSGVAKADRVRHAVRDRMRELGMTTAALARRTGLSETTIRGIGRACKTNRAVFVAVSAGLGWRYDHLANIACGQPEKNVQDASPANGNVKRMLQAEIAPLREQACILREELADLSRKLDAKNAHDPGGPARAKEPVTSVPVPDDMDADYSPQYVRLARKLRADIESGVLRHPGRVRATGLSERYGVSAPVARAALTMLAANSYVHRLDRFHTYKVADRREPVPSGALSGLKGRNPAGDTRGRREHVLVRLGFRYGVHGCRAGGFAGPPLCSLRLPRFDRCV